MIGFVSNYYLEIDDDVFDYRDRKADRIQLNKKI